MQEEAEMAARSSREDIMKQLDEKAREYLRISGNCAQSSFSALSDQFGLGNSIIRKALSPFPGIALRGETCGIVIGSLMALGLVYGQDELGQQEWVKTLRPCRAFCRTFAAEFGGTACDDVTRGLCGRTFNLADPAEAEEWRKTGVSGKCSDVVARGCRIAAGIMLDEKYKPA
jgi:C_GCAxxG_C_C family probable redox protein